MTVTLPPKLVTAAPGRKKGNPIHTYKHMYRGRNELQTPLLGRWGRVCLTPSLRVLPGRDSYGCWAPTPVSTGRVVEG